MKALFQLASLRDAVTKASRVVPTKTTKDVYKNVLLSVQGESFQVVASDTENYIRVTKNGVECKEPGTVLLNADRLVRILGELTSDVTLSGSDGSVQLKSGGSTFQIQTEDPADFHQNWSSTTGFVTVSGVSKALGRAVIACSSAAENMKEMGVCLKLEDDKLLVCGGDGRRISVAPLRATASENPGFDSADHPVIPKESAKALISVLEDAPATVSVSPSSVTFSTGGVIYQSARLTGGKNYPSNKRGMDLTAGFPAATIVGGPFITALRQAMILTQEDTLSVLFSFSPGKLTLSGKATSLGSSVIDVPVVFDGNGEIRLDPRMLFEAVRQIPGAEQFTFKVGEIARLETEDGWIYLQSGVDLG